MSKKRKISDWYLPTPSTSSENSTNFASNEPISKEENEQAPSVKNETAERSETKKNETTEKSDLNKANLKIILK